MSAIRTKKIIPVGVMKDIVLSTKFKMNTNFREVKEFLHSIDEFTTSISKDNIKIHPEIFPELKGFMECYEFYSKSKIKAVQIQFTGLRYGGISDICPVPHSQMRIVMFLQATKGYNELSIVAEGTEVSIPLPGSIGFIVPSNLSHLKIQANKIPFNSRRELKLGLFIIVDIEATDDQSGNMADNYSQSRSNHTAYNGRGNRCNQSSTTRNRPSTTSRRSCEPCEWANGNSRPSATHSRRNRPSATHSRRNRPSATYEPCE